jgi:oxygen-independent coproporphyrinogen-3 oxidase
VVEELRAYRNTPAMSQRELGFVYFGGGTPSLLPSKTLARMLERLQETVPWTTAKEVCFECAPKTVTAFKMKILRDNGVTRLSLGVQTFNDEVQRRNGRIHLAADVDRAYETIRAAGFPVVNLDLIVGLVGETEASFMESVDRVITMAPESVTIYQLEIPFNTPLYHAVNTGDSDIDLISWSTKRKLLGEAFARLEEAGYTVRSAYSAVRDVKKHEFVYQEAQYHGADLLGLGVASFSYVDGVHFQNVTSDSAYRDQVGRGDSPIGRAYSLSDDERLIREFILQLKLGRVDLVRLRDRFGVDPLDRFASPLDELRKNHLIESDDDEVTVTREGLLQIDRCLPLFYRPCHRDARYS